MDINKTIYSATIGDSENLTGIIPLGFGTIGIPVIHTKEWSGLGFFELDKEFEIGENAGGHHTRDTPTVLLQFHDVRSVDLMIGQLNEIRKRMYEVEGITRTTNHEKRGVR